MTFIFLWLRLGTCFKKIAASDIRPPRNDDEVLVFYVEDCRVAVSTAPRNDNEVLVFNVEDCRV